VDYSEQESQIVVNYYRDVEDSDHLIASDTLVLRERDFYQAPSFGDIVRLNKYLPQGYQTDYEPPEMRAISLQ